MKIAISNCLNMAGSSEKRRAVDSAVLAYYAGLTVEGVELVLVTVGSTKEDRAAAKKHGWQYAEASNDNVGAKRNAGMAKAMEADLVFRIGSDDLLSPALIAEVVRRAKIGHEKYWELRGFYLYDVPTRRLALHSLKQFALAFVPGEHMRGDLYNEDGRVIDAGLDIRLRSWCYPWYMITACEDYPMIALKSGDEINSFERAISLEPLLHHFKDADAVFSKFPNIAPSTLSGKPSRAWKASTGDSKSPKKVKDDAKST